MSPSESRFPRSSLPDRDRTGPAAAPSGPGRLLALAVAASLGLAAGCGPAGEPGDAAGADTAAVAVDGDTAEEVEAPDTVGPAAADSPAARPAADTAERPAPSRSDTAAGDTATRRWVPGGYMVYVRHGESPDSVAADHGVRPDTVLARLPGFYARLTAEQAGGLARDDRVKELARQLEERRPMGEPRGIPVAPDTGGG